MLVAASVTLPKHTRNSHRKFNSPSGENPILLQEEIQLSPPGNPPRLLSFLEPAACTGVTASLSPIEGSWGALLSWGRGGAVHKGGGGRGGGVSQGACSSQQIHQRNMVSAGTQEQGIMDMSVLYCIIRCLKRQFKPLKINHLYF